LKVVLADPVNPNIVVNVNTTPKSCGVQPQMPEITYGAKPGQDLSMPALNIGVTGAPGNVFWQLGTAGNCSGSLTSITCAPSVPNTTTDPIFNITAPGGDAGANPADPVNGQVKIRNVMGRTITAADVGREGHFNVQVAPAPDADPACTWNYNIHVVSSVPVGGWGDPHMTTVDGVNYDFQGAGEYTALKKDNFEIQTRQRPVSTVGPGGVNEHTGLASCVSIYSGVAARIGSNTVSLEPNLSGQPDPSGLQLRVNHTLVTLPKGGIDLRAGGSSSSTAALEGRIVQLDGGAYEFDTVDGAQLVATPAYWNDQQTWYMNLALYQASANAGIWGGIPSGSWLPALPDGTSVGPIPRGLSQRYQTLYTTFGNAWRVTPATSLFDYAQGTDTSSFTVADWPRFNPTSCTIPGQPTAMPADPQVAAQACSAITDPVQKANCTFDVTVTGFTGFAETYSKSQAFRPNGPGWQTALAGAGQAPPPTPTPTPTSAGWPWWVWVLIVIIILILIFVLFGKKKATP
jgi:hypothetical protein